MKKFIGIYLLVASFWMISCQSEKFKTTLSREGLKGNVKQVTVKNYTVNQWGEKESFTSFVEAYNKKGNCTLYEGYDNHGMMCRVYHYSYDIEGTLKEEYYYIVDGIDKKPKDKSLYKYDKSGRVIEKCVYEFDDKEDIEGKWIFIKKCTYDYGRENGNLLIKEEVFDDKEVLMASSRCEYNEQMEIVAREDTNKYTYKQDAYDEMDNWTQQSIYKEGKLESVEERTIEYYES